MAVRREKVILELEDQYSTKMAKAAAVTSLTARALDDLDGSAVRTEKSLPGVSRETDAISQSSRRATSDINQLTGRMALLARVGATVGPAFAPIAAVGAAGIAGLASQLGFATVGALSLMVASQGVGDALKAVNDAALEPTVANLDKAEQAMAKLVPQAQAFVSRFQELRPVLGDIRDAAARGWFPGLTEALDSIEDVAPRLERILFAVGSAGGDAVAAGANSLASERWAEFFQFIEDEAPEAISALSRSVGSLAHGFAELWMAFDPVNDGVRDWLVDVADSFDDWASGLDQTEGFAEFLAYVSENGPRVADAAGAIANAVLEIGEAAAPLGGPVLEGLTAVADVIAAIADSPLGTPIMTAVTALSAASLATRAWSASLGSLGSTSQIAGVGIVGLVTSANLLQTSFEKLADLRIDGGTLGRDLEALADGRVTENFDNLFHTFQDIDKLWQAKANPLSWVSDWDPTGAEAAEKNIKAIDTALASLVEGGDTDTAAKAFKELEAAGKDAGKSTEELTELFPEYATALENAVEPTEAAAVAVNKFAQKVERGQIAMAASRDAARESGKAFISFSDDIAGSEFSLSKWLKAFETQVKAVAAFSDNIQTLRERGLRPAVIDALIEQGPAAAQAVEGLAKSANGSIKRLNGAFATSRREIRGMGDDAAAAKGELLGLGNAKSRPTVELRAESFNAKMRAIADDLRVTDGKQATPKADLDKKPFDTKMSKLNGALGAADRRGAKPFVILQGVSEAERLLANLARPRNVAINPFVGGFGAANGTTVPTTGLGYADRHPYLLADGEEVVSNSRGQASAYRPVLKAINAGMPPVVVKGMLANGGTAQSIRVSSPATQYAAEMSVSGGTDPAVLRELRELRAAVNRGTRVNAGEHDSDRRSMRAGAGAIARSKPRGQIG